MGIALSTQAEERVWPKMADFGRCFRCFYQIIAFVGRFPGHCQDSVVRYLLGRPLKWGEGARQAVSHDARRDRCRGVRV